MLSSVRTLIRDTDGRYASDGELRFFQKYLSTANSRISAYCKLQKAEPQIIAEVLRQIRNQDPTLFQGEQGDLTAKWQRDTVWVLRHCATALLLDDLNTLKDGLLTWVQTIMQAFGAQRSCLLTYATMQRVIGSWLTPEELVLMLPILEEVRMILGQQQTGDL